MRLFGDGQASHTAPVAGNRGRALQISQNPPETAPRIALVLGAAVWPGGVPSPTLRRRAEHAAALFHAGRVSGVIACGGLGRYPPSEAEIILGLCRAAGVPEDCLWREDRSTTTIENIRFALPILQGIGTSRVVIVSDRYHLPRALLTARRFGLDAIGDPAPRGDTPYWKRLRLILREAPALIWYAIRLR